MKLSCKIGLNMSNQGALQIHGCEYYISDQSGADKEHLEPASPAGPGH